MSGPVYRVMSKVLKKLADVSVSTPCQDFVRYMHFLLILRAIPLLLHHVLVDLVGGKLTAVERFPAALLTHATNAYPSLFYGSARDGSNCISCALKNEQGTLYPLKNALLYIFKVCFLGKACCASSLVLCPQALQMLCWLLC